MQSINYPPDNANIHTIYVCGLTVCALLQLQTRTERDTILYLSIYVHSYMVVCMQFSLFRLGFVIYFNNFRIVKHTIYRRVLSPPMSSAINEPSPTSFIVIATAHAAHELQLNGIF